MTCAVLHLVVRAGGGELRCRELWSCDSSLASGEFLLLLLPGGLAGTSLRRGSGAHCRLCLLPRAPCVPEFPGGP